MLKNIVYYSCIVLGITMLYYLMTETWYEIQKVLSDQSDYRIPVTKMTLWAMLLGVLIEWKGLKKILKGKISINFLAIPTLFLLVLIFIPSIYLEMKFGNGGPFFMEVLKIQDIKLTLSVLTGILLVRSLTNGNVNAK